MNHAARVIVLTAVGFALATPVGAMADREDAVVPGRTDVFIVGAFGSLQNPIGFCREEPCGTGQTSPQETLYNINGTALGLTWGEFQSVDATSRVKCLPDGATLVRLRLRGLIPGGVYSIFYRMLGPDSINPLCPNEERSVLVPAVRPRQTCPGVQDSRLVADAAGKASFLGRVPCRCLLDAMTVIIDVIYHLNGQTYGALPNQLEFATQVRACTADSDCRIDEQCASGLCQLMNCEANGNCRSCSSSFGRDAMRQAFIVQKQP